MPFGTTAEQLLVPSSHSASVGHAMRMSEPASLQSSLQICHQQAATVPVSLPEGIDAAIVRSSPQYEKVKIAMSEHVMRKPVGTHIPARAPPD